MTILRKTLNEMPEVFSSNEFVDLAKKNGYPKRHLSKIRGFLHMNAKQTTSKRMWAKHTTVHPQQDSIKTAIELLKSKGYKIMKPVNEWVEI